MTIYRTLIVGIILLMLQSINAAEAKIYTWVDQKGVTHFSEFPPQEENQTIKQFKNEVYFPDEPVVNEPVVEKQGQEKKKDQEQTQEIKPASKEQDKQAASVRKSSAEAYRIDELANCYLHYGRTNLEIKLRHEPGQLLDVLENEFEITAWKDNMANIIGSKQAGSRNAFPNRGLPVKYASYFVDTDRSSLITFSVIKEVGPAVTSCTAEGVLAYRFATGKATGQTEAIEVKKGTTFKMAGIPFFISGANEIFPIKQKDGSTLYSIGIKCEKGSFAAQDYDFVDKLKLCDAIGNVVEERLNQKTTWSDGTGKEGFHYTWMLKDSKMDTITIKYELWKKIEIMRTPFKVKADIKRK